MTGDYFMKNSTRTQLNIYLALGTSEYEEVKMIDYFFDHGDMKGVTGSSFNWCSPDYIEERNSVEFVIDFAGHVYEESETEQERFDTIEEWAEDVIKSYQYNSDGVFCFHDNSYVYELSEDQDFMKYAEEKFTDNKKLDDLYNEERGTFECVGGGRCFSEDEEDLSEYVNPRRRALHEVAKQYESGKISIDQVETFLKDNEIPFKKVTK